MPNKADPKPDSRAENVVKLSVPEHLRTGKVYAALQEQTMSKVYKQDPKLPQGKWIDENKSGPRSFQEVADAMYDTPEATPSPDVLKLHTDIIRQLEQEAKALRQSLTAAQAEIQRLQDTEREHKSLQKSYEDVWESRTETERALAAAQAEIQRLREELKIVVGICSSDTLPRKEQS